MLLLRNVNTYRKNGSKQFKFKPHKLKIAIQIQTYEKGLKIQSAMKSVFYIN